MGSALTNAGFQNNFICKLHIHFVQVAILHCVKLDRIGRLGH